MPKTTPRAAASAMTRRYAASTNASTAADSGFVLDCVSAPTHAYLCRWPDKVRCIVSEMTGDGDLCEELQHGHDSNRLTSIHNVPNVDGVHPTSTRDHCEDNVTTTTSTSAWTGTATTTTATTANGGCTGEGGGASYDDADNQQQQKPDLGGTVDDEDHDCQSIDGDVDAHKRCGVRLLGAGAH